MKKMLSGVIAVGMLVPLAMKGENLVKGGNGENGNIWNPVAKISKENKKTGTSSFKFEGQAKIVKSKQAISVDTAKKYKLSGFMKSSDPGKLSLISFGLIMLDSKKRPILGSNVSVRKESDTVLAKAASKGTKSIFIADGSKWQKRRSIRTQVAFKTKKDLSDLPNFNISGLIGRVLKKKDGTWEVKLKKPLTHSYPAGTPVRQHYYGYAQQCAAAYKKVPAQWKEYKAELNGEALGTAPMNKFWKGTKFVKIVMVVNAARNGATLLVDDVCFEEIK